MTKHRNDYQGITFIPKLDDDDLGIAGATPRSSWPRMVLLVACYAAAAAAGIFCVHSLTGWLVIGLAPVLLLDRMTFRILSPTGPESRIIQIGIRACYLFLGAFGFTYLHDSAISQTEAFYAGAESLGFGEKRDADVVFIPSLRGG